MESCDFESKDAPEEQGEPQKMSIDDDPVNGYEDDPNMSDGQGLADESSLPNLSGFTTPDRSAQRSLDDIVLPAQKSYDYLLKVLLVGDSDVGKQEILSELEDGIVESPYCSSTGGAGELKA